MPDFNLAASMLRRIVGAYAQRVRSSVVYVRLITWLSIVIAHPYTRACRNACRNAFAFLVGDAFEDERVAFSTKRLVANDAYRDRLLAPEIADLVVLCEAMQLSIEQRKAFFRCFLHLDYLRRAGVSRTELLRYCALHDAPAAHFVLPSDDAFAVAASAHRSDEFRTQRWDILQLLALTFSLCTMETSTLVDLCAKEIEKRANSTAVASSSDEELDRKIAAEDGRGESHDERWARQIDACLAFSYGMPSPVEKKLAAFVCCLYSQGGKVDFVGVHGITRVEDIITLFPVLLFPCVWLQRVIKRRVMGDATWRKLASRRAELQLAGLGTGFASVAEILVASKAHREHRERRTGKQDDHTPLPELPQAALSTPRKVLPVEDKLHPSEATAPLHLWPAELQNEDNTWRATADTVLATVFVGQQASGDEGVVLTTQDATVLFDQTRREIQSRTLLPSNVARIQRELIHRYGYQFMAFIFSKSSIHKASGELVCTASVKQDLRRATQRHRKADEGTPLVEDKAVYWKEYSDPVVQRVFYHNVRTGESRWEMPSTLLLTKTRKKRKRLPTNHGLNSV